MEQGDPDGDFFWGVFHSLPSVACCILHLQPGEISQFWTLCSGKIIWLRNLSAWYWSRNGDLQLIWGALWVGAQPSRTFINLPNITFWYCLYHPPTFPLRIAAAKRRNDAGRQLDSWCYIICLELQLSYENLFVVIKILNEIRSWSNLRTFAGTPPHLSSPRAGSDQVHLSTQRENIWENLDPQFFVPPKEKAHPSANSSWICSRGAGKAKLSWNRFSCGLFVSRFWVFR